MVSEQRRSTYAAAVSGTGESSHRSLIIQSPIRTGNPQRNSAPQRGGESDDVENPLHLNSNESSNAILVSLPLSSSSNYGTWSIAMRVALEVKNKWGIVNGSIAVSDLSSNQYPAWRRCNLMICSWLCKSVHPSIVQSIMHMEKATDVWNDLKKRFEQRDAHRISILQREIYDLKQDPLPDIHRVYVMIEKFERQLHIVNPIRLEIVHANTAQMNQQMSLNVNDELAAAVHYLNNRKNYGNAGNRIPKCTFCGMNGHTVEKCYKRHNYPSLYMLIL
ncbi:uncharacterized protein LOC116010441 [Ipomoea triloba]|uniref:uncharacterized protein LOC116010441 n=1 Tax=Ipomoea triloba TaxID=35885 RepID=UPI00125D4A56|nr:uncharacterized protein LOC116010441 [Ipomoea triloba]